MPWNNFFLDQGIVMMIRLYLCKLRYAQFIK